MFINETGLEWAFEQTGLVQQKAEFLRRKRVDFPDSGATNLVPDNRLPSNIDTRQLPWEGQYAFWFLKVMSSAFPNSNVQLATDRNLECYKPIVYLGICEALVAFGLENTHCTDYRADSLDDWQQCLIPYGSPDYVPKLEKFLADSGWSVKLGKISSNITRSRRAK